MDIKVMILNCLNWTKGEKKGSTIVYLIATKEYFENTERFIGYNTITNFYNEHIRDLIPKEAIGQVINAKLTNKRSLKDPSIIYSKLESIEVNGKVISLL